MSFRVPTQSDRIDWGVAIEHYNWDRMEAAHAYAEEIGIGHAAGYLAWYRMIEAEYATRTQSRRDTLTSWLELEWIPAEVGDAADLLQRAVVRGADLAAERLEWEHGRRTLVSVLAQETDAPWTTGRWGFCVEKHPYEKICLPLHLAGDEAALVEAAAHEYAHVVTLNRTQKRIPRWLDEAVAVVVQGGVDPATAARFASGEIGWHSPTSLQTAYHLELDDWADRQRLWEAYQQSGLIGEFLSARHGKRALARLLDAYANNTIATELRMLLKNESPTHEAIHEAFGIGVAELFSQAELWIKNGR